MALNSYQLLTIRQPFGVFVKEKRTGAIQEIEIDCREWCDAEKDIRYYTVQERIVSGTATWARAGDAVIPESELRSVRIDCVGYLDLSSGKDQQARELARSWRRSRSPPPAPVQGLCVSCGEQPATGRSPYDGAALCAGCRVQDARDVEAGS